MIKTGQTENLLATNPARLLPAQLSKLEGKAVSSSADLLHVDPREMRFQLVEKLFRSARKLDEPVLLRSLDRQPTKLSNGKDLATRRHP